MNTLKLPEQLPGPWEHALILTYGAQLPFFETALWSQFDTPCRHKLILADGRQFLEACDAYAQTGLVRYLNQRYIAEGIFSRHSAHAKAILLVNREQGRLLIGSGNLSRQGYASGGELFSQHEYNQKAPDALPAFLNVWDMVQEISSRGYLSSVAQRHLQHIQENALWLTRPLEGQASPVRHNLRQSFLEQLKIEVGKEPVQELWLLAPFLDKEASALRRLLEVFKPQQAVLLLQPGQGSADLEALNKVRQRFTQLEIRPFQMRGETIYVHAKLFLFKLPRRAICLQGSPNLSAAALLNVDPHGNIELANLLSDKRNAFDPLLDALILEPAVADLGTLDVTYHSSISEPGLETASWYLIGGEWAGNQLDLSFRGRLPDLVVAELMVAHQPFPLHLIRSAPGRLEVEISAEVAELLNRPVPLAIQWGRAQDEITNPIFVCNRASLEVELKIRDEGETIRSLGHLELGDDELEELLFELENTLVIDHRSVWQLIGHTVPETSDDTEDDKDIRLAYADIDYEMLRRHPKIQQYLRRGSGATGLARSRLEIILNAITDHFRGLLDLQAVNRILPPEPSDLEPTEMQTEEDAEAEEIARQKHRLSQARRVNRLLRNFIKRYLRGFRSHDFQKLVGHEVLTQNYIVFSHILWRLLTKEWVEADFLAEAQLAIWDSFWTAGPSRGYFGSLSAEQQADALVLLQQYELGGQLLASIHTFGSILADLVIDYRGEGNDDGAVEVQKQRLHLRDFWRSILTTLQFGPADLETAWRLVGTQFTYDPPTPLKIVVALGVLAQLTSRVNLIEALAHRSNISPKSCGFDRATVYVPSARGEATIEVLVLTDPRPLDSYDSALATLGEWMRAEKRDYYRIVYPDANRSERLIFFDVAERDGTYHRKDTRETRDFRSVALGETPWETQLQNLQAIAEDLNAQLTLTVWQKEVRPGGT